MKNRTQLVIGVILIAIGLVYVLGILFNIDLGRALFALLLIGIGVWILFRPKTGKDYSNFRFIHEVRKRGSWQVQDTEYWSFVGDIILDLSEAEIPDGETEFRIQNFVGDLKLYVPDDVGVMVSATGFISTVRMFGQKSESFFAPMDLKSDNYDSAVKKIRVERSSFVSEVKIRKAE